MDKYCLIIGVVLTDFMDQITLAVAVIDGAWNWKLTIIAVCIINIFRHRFCVPNI
ncbi:MAG: hypothetical protein JRI53_12150 [Deltaproteobacteria bacterium]|nr:hypothetical protein [Deltaproteobacteria bacterium]